MSTSDCGFHKDISSSICNILKVNFEIYTIISIYQYFISRYYRYIINDNMQNTSELHVGAVLKSRGNAGTRRTVTLFSWGNDVPLLFRFNIDETRNGFRDYMIIMSPRG